MGIHLRPICWHWAAEWAASWLDQHGWNLVESRQQQWQPPLWQQLLQRKQTTNINKQDFPEDCNNKSIHEEEGDNQGDFFCISNSSSCIATIQTAKKKNTPTKEEEKKINSYNYSGRKKTSPTCTTTSNKRTGWCNCYYLCCHSGFYVSLLFFFSLFHSSSPFHSSISASHPFRSCTGVNIWKP